MELEEEDGALIAAVGPTTLHFVGENALIASSLDIKPPNAETTMKGRSCLGNQGRKLELQVMLKEGNSVKQQGAGKTR